MKFIQLLMLWSLIAFLPVDLTGQDELPYINVGNVVTFDISYGFHLPAGDMKDRFGLSSEVGGDLEFMTDENNWIFGLSAGYFFGKKVKEDVLVNIRTSEGNIIGVTGRWANVVLQERGIHSKVHFGKLIGLMKNNKRSGLRLTLGLGVLQHKIRLEEDKQNTVPQITGNYAKGYDRLSNGLAVTEFIGYQHMSNNRLINFYFGFEFIQAFTKNRRDWDFLLNAKDETGRTDLMMGVKLGWILPFYISSKASDNIRY